jgi:hypothetical protein
MAKDDCKKPSPQFPWERLESAMEASDASNGGGAGAGIPDGDTALRMGDVVTRGDPQKDKEKLFPDQVAKEREQAKGNENDLRGV